MRGFVIYLFNEIDESANESKYVKIIHNKVLASTKAIAIKKIYYATIS
jgi:hypothetical protein